MTYRIDLSPCINCGLCRRACPTDTIRFFTTGRRTHVIEPGGCIDCGLCAPVCPVDCISYDPLYKHDPVELEQARGQARLWARNRHTTRESARDRALEIARRVAAAQS
ncbi:MAG: 4Fe-4S dicluster domain-containing protein [Dehalococcoidia bacterium]